MMKKTDRILVMCQAGCTRSVATACVLKLKYRFKDVLTSGVKFTSPETLELLLPWADRILVVGEEGLLRGLPESVRNSGKVRHLDVGRDVWTREYASLPSYQDLVSTCSRAISDWIAEEGLEEDEPVRECVCELQ